MKKLLIYLISTLVAILISGYLSYGYGSFVKYAADGGDAYAPVYSHFINLVEFVSWFPWVLLAVFVPVTAAIFYIAGRRKKHSIQIVQGKGEIK